MAVELLRWAKPWLGLTESPIWVVAEGAYSKAAFLKPAMALFMTVVGQLRKHSALRTLPDAQPAGELSQPRAYGEDEIDLSKRSGQPRGRSTETFTLYRAATVKRYSALLATWQSAGGAIGLVLVEQSTGWRAYFSIHPSASVADILGRWPSEIARRSPFASASRSWVPASR